MQLQHQSRIHSNHFDHYKNEHNFIYNSCSCLLIQPIIYFKFCATIYFFQIAYITVGLLHRESHLSKGSSGCKQKCTQFRRPFSGTVFHSLSHDMIHFVRSVSFKNHEWEVSDWLLKKFNHWETGLSS